MRSGGGRVRPERLGASTATSRRYVDDGRLPGWLVARQPARARSRICRRTASATWRPGCRSSPTRFPHLLDDQADHLGRRDDALRGGRVRAHRPGQRVHPVVRRHARLRAGPATSPVTAPGRRADADLAPAHPHRRAHLRVPRTPARSTRSTGRRASSGARRPGSTSTACVRRVGGAAAALPAGHRVELLRRHRRARAASSRWSPGSRWTVLRRADLRAAGDDRHRLLRRGGRRGPAGRALHAGPRTGGPIPLDDARQRVPPAAGAAPGGGGLVSHRRRLPPVHPDAARAAASSTACGCSAPHRRVHGPQPSARRRRPGGVRSAAVRRDHLRGRRLRAGLRRRTGPGERQVPGLARASSAGAAPRARRSGWIRPRRSRPSSSPSCCRPSTHPIRPQLRKLVYQALVD